MRTKVSSFAEAIAELHELDIERPIGKTGKDQAVLVNNRAGKRFVLKYGEKVNPYEGGLMSTASKLDLSFRVPELAIYNDSPHAATRFLIREFIAQDHVAEVSKAPGGNTLMLDQMLGIAKDYQAVLKRHPRTQAIAPIQAKKAMLRFMAALGWWETQMLQATPASRKAILQISRDLISLYQKYGDELMGYAHGDIHPEHVLYEPGEKPVLLDLNAQVKPGPSGLYDHVRVLDASLAHSFTPKRLALILSKYIAKLEEQFGREFVRPLVRARMLAIGTDIEKDHRRRKGMPDLEARRRLSHMLVEASHS